jgi:hypothetical protein
MDPAFDPDTLAGLGARLRDAGLSERAVRACFGVRHPVHAPLVAAGVAPPTPMPPAALVPWLLVAGAEVDERAARRRLGDADLDLLCALDAVERDGGRVRAKVALLPVAGGLAASDRADVRRGRDAVLWPDDSAFHLIGALPPGRRRRWLDVGTGNAVAPLAAPGRAERAVGTDVCARALELGRLGVALSGARSIELRAADLLDGADAGAPWDLTTFNAPIPADAATDAADDTPYRHGPADLLERFWRAAPALCAPDGEVLLHARQPADGYPDTLDLPGSVVAVRYTPPDARVAFGVTVWRPARRAERRLVNVALDPDRPHLDRRTLDLS